MRLERLEISGFGRLHDLTVDFGERLTVVLGHNESGKSTLHRALRAALYGLDAGGQGRPVERSDWARWLPWGGVAYGIALTYRLDDGRRFRVAHRLDSRESDAQVVELGGGDVTDKLRTGRLVTPGRHHLGIDEGVFCAAAWLGEDGLRLSSPDGAPARAAQVQEAIERLADSGRGATAAEALNRLREAMQRVGSERRSQSPLGIATARLRRLETEISAARARSAEHAEEQARLRALERIAAEAEEEARAAEIRLLGARLASLRAQAREIESAGREMAELTATLEATADAARFSLEDEQRVIALGGELRQAEQASAIALSHWDEARPLLEQTLRRRAEIAGGLEAMAADPPVPPAAPEALETLRRRLAGEGAATRREEALAAATSRFEALGREIASTGLAALPAERIGAVGDLVATARDGGRGGRLLAMLGGVMLLGGVITVLGPGMGGHSAVWLVAGLLAAIAGLALATGRITAGQGHRARRELARLMPGVRIDRETLDALTEELPGLERLHTERRRQAALVEAHREELEQARAEIEATAARCLALATACGAEVPAPLDGSPLDQVVQAAHTALDRVAAAIAAERRRAELRAEDAVLKEQHSQLEALGAEASRAAGVTADLEARLRHLLVRDGIPAGMPIEEAVAAHHDACHRRREHDRAKAQLQEVAHRVRLAGGDAQRLRRDAEALAADLRRHGLDPEAVELTAGDPSGVEDLERRARAAAERARDAASRAAALRGRLEGLLGSLASVADLEDERAAMAAERDRCLHQLAALQRAAELIAAASQGVHRELAPRLATSLRERLALLTDNRYRDANVDTDHFAVSLLCEDRPDLIPVEHTSHGTRDQVALLLRLALSEVLSGGGEAVPLLLDEPLLASDPLRRRSLVEFLARLSSANQVVVTTSDPGLAGALVGLCPEDAATYVDLDSHHAGAELPRELELTVSAEPPLPRRRARLSRRGH